MNNRINNKNCKLFSGRVICFARHTSRPFAKPKEPFFATAPDDSNELDLDRMLKNMFNILHLIKARNLSLTH